MWTYVSFSTLLEAPVDLCLDGERDVVHVELACLAGVLRVRQRVEQDVGRVAYGQTRE